MPRPEVIALPPRSNSGAFRNGTWTYVYNMESKRFHWRVVFRTEHVLEGDSPNEQEAREAVEKAIKRVRQPGNT